jgi:nucleotide-binding universal stress UspA family protein
MAGRVLADAAALRVVSIVGDTRLSGSTMLVSPDVATSQRTVMKRLKGDPAATISELARESNAAMIVCALGEKALRLIRRAHVPVFAAAETLDGAPSRIIIATDFSESSLRAARAAVAVASRSATVYLVHVTPSTRRGRRRASAAVEALTAMAASLGAPRGMIVEPVLLEGDPARRVVIFAAGVRGDLIATGSHGRGFVARLLVGSVATQIVRASPCSVLTMPRAA